MVSVKRFIHDEPALFKASKAFVALLFKCADPIVYVAQKMPTANEQIAWTLLGTVLFQDRSYPDILRLLVKLHERFPGDKLWSLPVPKGGEIEEVVEQTFNSRNWTVFEHVSGIFWSVGLFVRHHPDLVAWARERTPEEMWRDLGEIYFMGKRGARPKACAAIYRLCGKSPAGLGYGVGRGLKRFRWPDLPLTMGARRFLSIMGPAREGGFADLSPEQKQKMMNEFCVALYPENPYAVAHSLQFYLEEGEESFMCRECQAGCANCALYEFCDYGVQA